MVDQNNMPVHLIGHDNILVQEWRDAEDAKRDFEVAVSALFFTTAYYAPGALPPYVPLRHTIAGTSRAAQYFR